MNIPNLGWLYYRDMYNEQRKESIIEDNGKNKELLFSFKYLIYPSTKEGKEQKKAILNDNSLILSNRGQKIFNEKLINHKPEQYHRCKVARSEFDLTTTYPGLICGVGYNHGISCESDFKVGFYFDHTTGIPIIPGSSVKGVLRSAFPQFILANEEKLSKEEKEEFKRRYDFFNWIIDEVNRKTGTKIKQFTHDEIDKLEAFIFSGLEENGKQLSYYKRDIFFDAYPIKSTDKKGLFLKNDYITPHINRDKLEMSPFTNPIPIQFLKVLPRVHFQFQFKLIDGGGLTVEEKLSLFREILCFNGIGAKTNVGYGQFEEGFKESAKHERTTGNNPVQSEPENFTKRVTEGATLEAKVIDKESRNVKIIVNGKEQHLTMSTRNCPENGTIVQVEITQLNKQKDILMVKQAQGI